MWTLVPGHAGAPQFWLGAKEYLMGRKDADIVLPEDKSISRSHAYLTVGSVEPAQAKNPSYRPTIVLKDKSKFGTFLNQKRIDPGEPCILAEGDVLHFGELRKDIRYEVAWLPLVVCTSSLAKEDSLRAKDLLLKLGARISDVVDVGCTLLLTTEVKAVTKVMLALALGLPIVHVLWLVDATERSDCSKPLPETAFFLPPIHGDWDVFGDLQPEAFKVNPLRPTLFSRLTFLFRDKGKMESHAPLIRAAKGTAVWDDSPVLAAFPIQYPNAVVVRADAADLDPAYEQLERLGFPVVSSHALQLAILHANADAIRPRPTDPFSQNTPRPILVPPRPPPTSPQPVVARTGTDTSLVSAVPSAAALSTVPSSGAVSTDRAGTTPRLGMDPDGGTPTLHVAGDQPAGLATSHLSQPSEQRSIDWIRSRAGDNLVVEVMVPLVAQQRPRAELLPYFKWKSTAATGAKCFRKQQLPPPTNSFVAVVDSTEEVEIPSLLDLRAPDADPEDDVGLMAHDHWQAAISPVRGFPTAQPTRSPIRRPTAAAAGAPKAKRRKSEATPTPKPVPPPPRRPLAHATQSAKAAAVRLAGLQQQLDAAEDDEFGLFARRRETPTQPHDTFEFNED